MSKTESSSSPTPADKVASEFNTLRGRVLGFIEACGLPERQETGMKSTFKSLTYDAESRIKTLVE